MKILRGCQLLTLMLPFWELKHAPMLLTALANHPLHLNLPSFTSQTPEGRSPSQSTSPSKKPREGVVLPRTGKPFILGSSLLTDSCVDWKLGCMLYGPRLRQSCGLSVPDLPYLHLGPLHLSPPQVQMHQYPPTPILPPTLTSPHHHSIFIFVSAMQTTALHLVSN